MKKKTEDIQGSISALLAIVRALDEKIDTIDCNLCKVIKSLNQNNGGIDVDD